MLTDAQGLPVTTNAPEAVEAIAQFTDQILGYGSQADVILKGWEADPTSALINAHIAALHLWAEAADSVAKAQSYLQAAQTASPIATEREQWYVKAIAAWAEGDIDRALAYHEALAKQYPRDLVAASLGQYHYLFNRASSSGLLRLANAVFPANSDNHYAYGMLAFALEQNHQLDEAETIGRRAIAMNRQDPWAHHAVAHVLETQQRDRDGIAWLESLADTWETCGTFAGHNWWHLALFYLRQGDIDHVLHLYDQNVWGQADKAYIHCQLNAIALLIHLELAGAEVGDRWHHLPPYLAASIHQPLVELHIIYALARGEQPEAVQARLSSLTQYANAQCYRPHLWQTLVLPAANGIIAFVEGDRKTAATLLTPILPDLHQVGGSHAQRAVFQKICCAME